jgi:hypothetical protein
MKTSKQSKLGKNLTRMEARVSGNGHGAAVDTLDAPRFPVRLVGPDNEKRFSVPIVIRNRHD